MLRLSLGLCVILCFGGAATASTRTDLASPSLAASQQKLEAFYVSHSLDDLRGAISPLEQAVDMAAIDPRDYVALRRKILSGWARVFETIEASYDSSGYPKMQLSCPAPGREPSGRQLYACVDPKYIQDTAVRAAYVAALDVYKAKVRHANFQAGLHDLDDDAMLVLQAQLHSFREVAPSDFSSLDSILQRAGLSTARRQAIDAMILGRQVR